MAESNQTPSFETKILSLLRGVHPKWTSALATNTTKEGLALALAVVIGHHFTLFPVHVHVHVFLLRGHRRKEANRGGNGLM